MSWNIYKDTQEKQMKINLHTSHPSAFISSTFIDLKEERNAVANVLREYNLNINALDIKPASNDSSRKEIISGIKESDFIILIVGERYGSIIPQMTLSKELSITRWEYIRAVKSFGKHALVYFKRVESKDPKHYDDQGIVDFDTKRQYLGEFKKELSGVHNPKYFTTPEELAEEVRKAIIPTYRSGVKSLVSMNEALSKKIEALEQENERLKSAPKSSEPFPVKLPKPRIGGLLEGLDMDYVSSPDNKKPDGLINFGKNT
jgi:hypothetical protein